MSRSNWVFCWYCKKLQSDILNRGVLQAVLLRCMSSQTNVSPEVSCDQLVRVIKHSSNVARKRPGTILDTRMFLFLFVAFPRSVVCGTLTFLRPETKQSPVFL